MNKFQQKKKNNNNKKRKRIVIDEIDNFPNNANKICLLINSELLSKFSIIDQQLFSIQKKKIYIKIKLRSTMNMRQTVLFLVL